MIRQDHIAIVVPVHRAPLPIPRLAGKLDQIAPLPLREMIAGALAAAALPLLDSRTRYWRYYLLIGPSPQWRPQALGQKLLSIVRQNIESERARKGIGSRLYNRSRLDGQRRASVRELRRLVNGFKSQYGAAAKRFWDKAKSHSSYSTLLRASQLLRSATDLRGFFESNMPTLADGHARAAFHRLMIHQTPVAEDLAPVLLRGDSVWQALAKIKRTSIQLDDSRRLILAWILLVVLFTTKPSIVDRPHRQLEDDADIGEQPDGSLAGLACVARNMLAACVFELDAVTRSRLLELLDSALVRKPYTPPVALAARDDDGSRRRLFADLRLSSFHRLLEATR